MFDNYRGSTPHFVPLLLIAVCLSLLCPWSVQAAWQPLPTGDHDASGFACDSDELSLFTLTNRSTVWISHDAGVNWRGVRTPVFASPTVTVTGLWALDPGSDTVFVSGFETQGGRGVQSYTFDGGQTWHAFSQPFVTTGHENYLQVWQAGHHVWFYFGPNGHFARSTDYGVTWTDSTPFDQNTYPCGIFQDPVADSTIYAFGSYYWHPPNNTQCGGIMRSTDLGRTWASISPLHDIGVDDAWVWDMIRLTNGNLMALVRPFHDWDTDYVLRSTDNGASWQRIDGGLPDHFWLKQIVEDRLAPGTVFLAGGSGYSLFRSTDYGATWQPNGNGLPMNSAMCNGLYQHPFNGAVYVTVRGYGAFQTTDHGTSWSAVASPPVEETGPLYCVDGTPVYQGTGGKRTWQFNTDGQSWREIPTPLSIDTVVWMDPPSIVRGDTLIAGLRRRPYGPASDQFQLTYSSDGGGHWTHGPYLTFNSGAYNDPVQAVQRRDTTWLFTFVPSNTALQLSADRGQSWVERQFPQPLDNVFFGEAHNADALYILEGYGIDSTRIYRSTDLGVSWTDLQYAGPPDIYTKTMLPLGGELFAQAGDFPLDQTPLRCYHWANGVWDERGEIADDHFFSSFFAIPGPDTLLVGVSFDYVWTSSDFGYTWTRRDYSLPYGAENRGITFSVYDSTHARIWASTDCGLCYLDAVELAADRPLAFKPARHEVMTAYPNPFNSTTRITLDLVKPGPVTLALYDVLGRKVQTLVDEIKPAGSFAVRVDGATLPSGVYFARLDAGDTRITKKLVLLR